MKTTFKFLYVAISGIIILALFSFTKNQLLLANKVDAQKNKIVAGTAGGRKATRSQVLMSDGMNTMLYNADGTLYKVVASSFREIRYKVSRAQDQTLYTATLYSNDVITNRYTYKVNSSGLASNILSEQLDNGNTWLSWTDSCIYNTSGQLTRKFNGDGHYDFIYDDNGDVTNVRHYNCQNKLLTNMVLHYTTENSPLIDDLNNLMPENLELDPNLQIFGKFSNHLPLRIEYTDNATGGEKMDYSYSYELNSEGYILSSKKYISGSDKIVERKNYTYKL